MFVEKSMKINIRKAIPEDAHNFTDCHISCWQSAYKNIVGFCN